MNRIANPQAATWAMLIGAVCLILSIALAFGAGVVTLLEWLGL